MRRIKNTVAILLSIAMLATPVNTKNVLANYGDSLVTAFSYSYAYKTLGYAGGTIRITAKEDGLYRLFWADANGEKLKKNGYEYSCLAKVVVKDGKGAYNILNDYTAIPENAKKILVYKNGECQYTYDIPQERQFNHDGEGYSFGAISDLDIGKYDIANDAFDNALLFMENSEINFVGVTGDISGDRNNKNGEQTDFDAYNEIVKKHSNLTVLACTGNNDSQTTIKTDENNTAFSRWKKTITDSYFSVNDDGAIISKLNNGYKVIDTDANSAKISTYYRENNIEEAKELEEQGIDYTVQAGDNIIIFLNEIAVDGPNYDIYSRHLTAEQMDWLEEQLEKNNDKKVFLFFNRYLHIDTLNNDADDFHHNTGDVETNDGKGNTYSYGNDFHDYFGSNKGVDSKTDLDNGAQGTLHNISYMLNEHPNVTLVSGHSHWQYQLQSIYVNLNIGLLKNGEGATMIHLSSVTSPSYIEKNSVTPVDMAGKASEGSTITTYSDCVVYNSVDFKNGQYISDATYITKNGTSSKYAPIKDDTYKKATDALDPNDYLEPEDMTEEQLLKSTYNLAYGAAYLQSSKGNDNTADTLTNGSLTDGFVNTKWNKKNDQFMQIKLDGVQEVSNIDYFLLYFQNDNTDASNFNIELSLDGEKYYNIGTYTGKTYKDTKFEADTSNIEISQFKYIRLNLTSGHKNYGYQIKEFATIGKEKNKKTNTAESRSEVVFDEEDMIPTNYNIVYCADYIQSSVGTEDIVGKLTDGNTSGGYLQTKQGEDNNQSVIIPLDQECKVSNIDYALIYFNNQFTNSSKFDIEISEDGNNYEKIAEENQWNYEKNHVNINASKVDFKNFKYVKINLKDGHKDYGYQICEFALIGKEEIKYAEIPDQSDSVASAAKNIALNKKVTVSSTHNGEGEDSTVVTDGKKEAYWSSEWKQGKDSEYVIIDLGKAYNADTIQSVLVNFKEEATYCEDYTIEFSEDGNDYKEVARAKTNSWPRARRISDKNGYIVTNISYGEPDEVRYVKINMKGSKGYGYQIYEIAVLGGVEASDPIDIRDSQVKVTNPKENKVSVSWSENTSQKNKQQLYNVYLDEKIIVSRVKAGTYEYNAERGDHKIEVQAVSGKRLGKKIEKSIYVGGTPVNAENVTIKSKDLNTIEISFENGNGYIADQKYNIYINGKTVKENISAGQYKLENINAGENTIKVAGVLDGFLSSGIVNTIDVTGRKIESLLIPEIAYIYSGKAIIPTVTVNYEGRHLQKNKDFTITCSNNINAGNAKIVIKGIGLYEGILEGKFTIAPKNVNDVKVTVPKTYYTGKKLTPSVKATYGNMELKATKDFTIVYSGNVNPGKGTITLKGRGNYSGQKKIKFDVVVKAPAKVKISKVTQKSDKKVLLKWKKASGMSEYEIAYSTDRKFKKAVKTVKVKKNGGTIKRLKINKTYYFKVRAYRIVKGKKYYGTYSKVKKIKITK